MASHHAVERTASVGSTGRVSAPAMMSFSRQIVTASTRQGCALKNLSDTAHASLASARMGRMDTRVCLVDYLPPSESVSESPLCRGR